MTHGDPVIHEAFPFSNTGFLNKLSIVLRTHSAIEGHLSAYLE